MISCPALPEVRSTRDDPLACARAEGALALIISPAPDAQEDSGEAEPRSGPFEPLREVAAAYGIDLEAVVADQRVGGPGSVHVIELPPLLADGGPWQSLPRRVILAGAGGGDPRELRDAGTAVARAAAGLPHLVVALRAPLDAARSLALLEGLMLPAYRMPRIAAGEAPGRAACPEIVVSGELDEGSIPVAAAGVWGTFLARTLAATPSNIKDPEWLARQVTDLVAASADERLTVEVRDEDWLARRGLNAILAVGAGSASPPRLVSVRYDPAGSAPEVALVGKGITFDTGGLSLKPREAMVPMKTDMSGAAIVLAAVLAAARLDAPRPAVAVLALAENAFGGASCRPGDVVRTVDGTTVEIGNSDAEGRMVLADAIAWVRSEYAPAVVVDVATLTGAATLALGRGHAALYATDAALESALVDGGALHGEELWPMPLVEDYRDSLRSEVADLAHIANNEYVHAGSVIAALFLRHFARDTPWAHLDIAGPGRTGAKTPEMPAQAPTGFGVRTLLGLLLGAPAATAGA